MGSFDQKDAPKTCGLPVTVATPHGTGSGLTAGEDLQKNGVHFFPLKLSCSTSFLSSSAREPYECGLHLILQLHVFDLMSPTPARPTLPDKKKKKTELEGPQ